MDKNTAGPAFPSNGMMAASMLGGMTLRDYFAAKAMQGILSAVSKQVIEGLDGASKETIKRAFDDIAGMSYLYADRMLEARDK